MASPVPVIGHRHDRTRKNFDRMFFRAWSREMAYVLGFLFADGHLQQNPPGGRYVCITSTDKEIVLKIRALLRSNHHIGVRDKTKKNPRWKRQYVLQIGSKQVYADLNTLGLTRNKSLTMAFPKVSERFLGDFVRGYFDGDGCVHVGRYWRKDRGCWKWQFMTSFTSGSRRFLEELWRRLGPQVAGGHISSKKGGFELVFGQWDSVALFRLMYHNAPAATFLKRKYITFRRAFRILDLRA